MKALASPRGEIIVPTGNAAAHSIGLTTQVPVRSVYLTPGCRRKNEPGWPGIDVCHAPRWLLSWHVAGVTGGASACRVRSRAGRICTSGLE
ncbi:DUF6088 family protein [Paracoccus solventivorans]|uniref:DUF6088 family protein n=1 Tax=Paracoccus solventivorans TaxID=53463 RepID=UPI0032C2454B